MRTYLRVLIFAGIAGWSSATFAQAPPAGEVARSYMRQSKFYLPFSFRVEARPEDRPVEVQLYVSDDFGANWAIAEKVAPEEKKFEFQAPHDGEYWFFIRTKDQKFRLRPQEAAKPELKIIVDTAPPALDLFAQRGPAGEVHVKWRVGDANLDPKSFLISYRVEGQADWSRVATDPLQSDAPETLLTGEITFVESDSSPLMVRAELQDLAKNQTVDECHVPAATPAGGQKTAARQVKEADGSQDAAAAWPAEKTTEAPDNSIPPEMSSSFADDGAADSNPRGRTVVDPGHDAVTERYPATDVDPDAEAEAFQGELLPPGVTPRVVNSRKFELEYEVDTVGAAGVTSIELFGTIDGGETWTTYGADADNRSPMVVEVEGEGIFGFRMVVETSNGLRNELPQPGDQPEVWVAVDLTKPAARLVTAEQGQGEQAGALIIHWTAQDQKLASRPITLSFSETPGGPWTIIASGLENTGNYTWRLDKRIPDKIYLRLEVRDAANNVQIVDTAEPLSVDQIRPQGHIRGVRPVGDAAVRQSKTIYNLTR